MYPRYEGECEEGARKYLSDHAKREFAHRYLHRIRQFCPHVAESSNLLLLSYTAAVHLPAPMREHLYAIETGAAEPVSTLTVTDWQIAVAAQTAERQRANEERKQMRTERRKEGQAVLSALPRGIK